MRRVLPFLLLAGCATTPDDASYRALGTEPFWSIMIEGGRMTYDSPEGGFSVAAPRPQETGDGRLYQTRRITLHIWHGECSDGMSDRRYAETVRAEVDGRKLEGCGGAILPPAALAETSWTIVAIDGEPVRGNNYMLRFDANRLHGQAGCNRFSAPYALRQGHLAAGPVMSTRMACPEPRMTHERQVLRLLAGPVVTAHPDGDTLLLTGSGVNVRLRRAI